MLTLFSVIGLVSVLSDSLNDTLEQRQFEVVLEGIKIAQTGEVACELNLRYLPKDPDLLSIHGFVQGPSFSGDFVVTGVSGIDQRFVVSRPFVATGQYPPGRYLPISPNAAIRANVGISHFLTEEWYALPDEEKKATLRTARVCLQVQVDEVEYEQLKDLRIAFLIGTPRDTFRQVQLVSTVQMAVDFAQ